MYFPIYNLCDGGIGSIQTSQAGSMTTKGVPNDFFVVFNPLIIIILIPILETIVYPFLRRFRIEFYPVYRIAFGFLVAVCSQVAGAVIQHRIYVTSPCGHFATQCQMVSPLSGWLEVTPYLLQAASECFAMTTAYELAYTRSPPHMKGLVMALFLFISAISAAISQAIDPALTDPYLIWPFVACAVAGFVTTILFVFQFRNLHRVMEKERLEREGLS